MKTINHLLETINTKYGSGTAFKYKSGEDIVEKSYKQFYSDSRCFASYLKKIYGTNNNIGILSPTSYEWIITYFAITLSGNCAVTLDFALNVEELCKLIDFADINVLFISEKFSAYTNVISTNCPKIKEIFVLENDIEELTLSDYRLVDETKPEDVAQIIFTSGTTGKSKGVMLTHENITYFYYYGINIANASTTSLSILPLHHVTELIFGLLATLASGGTVCLNDKIENMQANLQIFKPSMMTVVPLIVNKYAQAINAMLKQQNIPDEFIYSKSMCERRQLFAAFIEKAFGGNLNAFLVGGSSADPENIKTIEKLGIYVIQGYGMTETAGVISSNEYVTRRLDTCGRIYGKDIQYKTEDGELLIKGSNVFKGYFKDEEETLNAFTPDGYFKTGDLVEIDEDGFVTVVGRKKNLIILSNGENVSPEGIQAEIDNIPGASMSVVYENNNKLCAIIYVETRNEEIENSIKEAINGLNDTYPNYKKIVEVSFTDKPFPMTTKRSIKRGEVIKNLVKKQEVKKEIVLPQTEFEIKLYNRIKEMLHLTDDEEFSIEDNIFDLGIDSINVFELATQFNLNVQEIYNAGTIKNIANISAPKKTSINDNTINDLIKLNKNISYENSKDNYFITGANGYLGSFILHELSDKTVYVLVRDKYKLLNTYRYYFDEELPKNVKIFIGDVRYPDFALSTNDYNMLLSKVDHVIHSAAIVKHMGKESDFMDINVEGTKNAIDFAKKACASLHYVSSYSVCGFGLTYQEQSGLVFTEKQLDIGQNYTQNVYVYTKYLAEKEVLKARSEGLKANIYRIGSLTWTRAGIFQVNEDDNGLLNRLIGLRKLKKYSTNANKYPMDLTPVDECAKAFVTLMSSDRINNIYHLVNPYAVSIDDIANIYGDTYEEISKEDFKEISSKTDDKNIKFYADYELLTYDLNGNMIDCTKTCQVLHCLGFDWGTIDKSYLDFKLDI